VGVPCALEPPGGTCCRRRILWTGVAARYIYRANSVVPAFDGLQIWC
jgi:hypothetical protein